MRTTCVGCAAATLLVWLVFSTIARAAEQPGSPATSPVAVEPNYRIATQWWSELRKKWTPVGWKNHMFRYNVLFNGAIVADPGLNRRTSKWADQGVLVWPSLANPRDDGTIRQGWRHDHEAPVLWTNWNVPPYERAATSGARFQQEVFAHIPGAEDVRTGIEPLFAWVRVSIQGVEPKADSPKKSELSYRILAPAIGTHMRIVSNLRYSWKPYPRKLSFQPATESCPYAVLREPNGKIRLAVVAKKGCRVDFRALDIRSEGYGMRKTAVIEMEFDVRPDSYVDILIPMLPTPQDVVERECALGYDKALAQSDAYWGRVPATAATIDVPEEEVTAAIRHYLKMAEVIAEKDPATGEYCALTGSWTYANVWSTPNAMLPALLLDPMGYHTQAARYLATFAKHQGTRVPPGKTYKPHPGYLGTPKVYTAINWVSDNGALLWAFSRYALLSGDKKFIEKYTPTIIKSCEWIRDARRLTHGGIKGILPGGVATDECKEVQSIWNDGWNYKGLTTAVRLLKRIKHPRAAEFEAEAADYREKFRSAFFQVAKTTPTWTDTAGKVHAMAPRNLSGDKTWGFYRENTDLYHPFYLDCGPLFLVFAGLVDADDELICSNRAWFREGPTRRTYQDNGNCGQPPSLHHEMSSCEPCYSWVPSHSWQLGDRAKFLEGMYSLFAGASSQQTHTICETRGGITGVTPCVPTVWLARLSVIDGQIEEDALHLLRLVPLAWLRTDKQARFENMPTEFGPVTVKSQLTDDGKALDVSYQAKFHHPPKKVVLHVPPVAGLSKVTINGRMHQAKPGDRLTVE